MRHPVKKILSIILLVLPAGIVSSAHPQAFRIYEIEREAHQHLSGAGVPKSEEKAAELFQLAADAGSTGAMVQRALMYLDGRAGEQNDLKAVELYEKAAAMNDVYSQMSLGFLYYHGRGVPQDYEKAAKWFRKAAENRDKYSMNMLGFQYHYGNGLDRDLSQAFYWYREAYERGRIEAADNLMRSYLLGEGTEIDPAKARLLEERILSSTSAVALTSLGKLYLEDVVVDRDHEKARSIFLQAIEDHDRRIHCGGAFYKLAQYHLEGVGGAEHDPQKAYQYLYTSASEEDHDDSMVLLARMYGSGTGVEKNTKAAVEWYLRAAEMGYREGITDYALALMEGNGIEQKPELGRKLLSVAAETNDRRSRYYDALYRIMDSPEGFSDQGAFDALIELSESNHSHAAILLNLLKKTHPEVPVSIDQCKEYLEAICLQEYPFAPLLYKELYTPEEELVLVDTRFDVLYDRAVKEYLNGFPGYLEVGKYPSLKADLQGRNYILSLLKGSNLKLATYIEGRMALRGWGAMSDEKSKASIQLLNELAASGDEVAQAILEESR